ncbi:hypothetical protein HO133_006108 [Letharia lupina]|uniref:Uncharacterized protein n=1 Tax=Letharia lupina TaxID=560253 RepID=A0A8H6F839_9LECA|nr:uncharacterized protein HO133_006108 [Letharia lupina]KAF6218149.1 hypothetical protein HO133_006108 [Letharia lupina]
MYDQIPTDPPHDDDPFRQPQICDHRTMPTTLNLSIHGAPAFAKAKHRSTDTAWLGPAAMAAMPISDSELLCDPAAPYHGFTFRDGYFTHQCWPGVRLIACTGDESVVIDACEAAPSRGGRDIEAYDGCRLNEKPYWFHYCLVAGDALAPQSVGGTVYQANLRSLNYHRWYSPVTGTLMKTYVVPGAYHRERSVE